MDAGKVETGMTKSAESMSNPAEDRSPVPRDSGRSGQLATTEGGRTTIADTVVQKIAGIATREVSGVHQVGGSLSRTFGAIRERIPGASSNVSQGVGVEVGEKEAAVDLVIVVEYGASISDLAQVIRHNVITAIERMTGLQVIEVNINIDDLVLPGEDDAQSSSDSRVQ